MSLLVAFAALGMGGVLGFLGGGGSILTVPILVFLAGVDAKSAIATSLLVVAMTSAFAIVQHARAGRVRWKTGLTFGAVAMVGAYGGGTLGSMLPGDVLMAAFVLVMFVTAIMMLRGRTAGPVQTPEPNFARTATVGLGMGALTGLVGAGGGFMIVPALLFFGGLSMPEAIATSLLVITMNAISGFAGHLGRTHIDLPLAGGVIACSVAGAFAGVALGQKIPAGNLKQVFGVFVLCMAGLTSYLTWLA
ncbi:MAG: sulfite exporter TauE/SafE family protein [Myxococcota bacterium]